MKKWLKETGIKTLKTMAQTALAMIGVATVVQDVDWLYVLSATVLSGIVCILMNISAIEMKEGESVG